MAGLFGKGKPSKDTHINLRYPAVRAALYYAIPTIPFYDIDKRSACAALGFRTELFYVFFHSLIQNTRVVGFQIFAWAPK
jgi:hypothetical protein